MADSSVYTQTVAEQAATSLKNSHPEAKRSLNQQGLEALKALELPASRHEEYRYTQLSKLLAKEFPQGFPANPESKIPVQELNIEGLEGYKFNFINGKLSPVGNSLEALRQEAKAYSLAEVFEQDPALAAKLGTVAPSDSDAFIALNTTYSDEGLVLDIPKNTRVSQPVILAFYSLAISKVSAMPRCFIRLGQGAELTLVESVNSQGESTSFLNSLLEIELGANASLKHYKIQTESDSALQLNTTQVNQASDSRYNITTITLGGRLVRNNLNIALQGTNCETHMYGLYMLHGKQHVDNHTLVDHQQPHCESNELYKGIMDDQSTGVFNGKIYVQQIAQKTNAFQSNKNILLSDGAAINTKPQLEIWADDVKCSHGATTGQIDEEQVFYLRSRGLNEKSARALLLRAFAADIIDHIELDSLRNHFLNLLDQKLETKFI